MPANFRLVVFVRLTAPHRDLERSRKLPWSKPIQATVRFFIAWRRKKRPARRTRRFVWLWPQVVYEEHGVCLHGRPCWILNPPDSSGWPSPRGANHDSLFGTDQNSVDFQNSINFDLDDEPPHQGRRVYHAAPKEPNIIEATWIISKNATLVFFGKAHGGRTERAAQGEAEANAYAR